LASLGLSGEEEDLYRALVEFPSADVGALLKSLAAQGLVARTGSTSDGRYVAASPAIALGPLVRQRREDLRTRPAKAGSTC